MHTRNDGKGESNILQNEFTAYLSVAVIRKKKDLLKKREHLQRHELSTDFKDGDLLDTFSTCMQDPLPLEFENQTLEAALNKLSPRDRYIFFTHILNERSFKSLCAELGMTYSGVAVAYHRVVHKLRKALGVSDSWTSKICCTAQKRGAATHRRNLPGSTIRCWSGRPL